MLRRTLLIGMILLAGGTAAAAQSTVFIVRHAERVDAGAATPETDPDLSTVGHARAWALAAMLKDTQLTAVYATQFKRTQQTAAPTAQAQGLTVTTIPADKTAALLEKLKGAKEAVLVVGHGDSVTEVMAGLGVANPVKVASTEFDNLFIVVVVAGAKPQLIQLRY